MEEEGFIRGAYMGVLGIIFIYLVMLDCGAFRFPILSCCSFSFSLFFGVGCEIFVPCLEISFDSGGLSVYCRRGVAASWLGSRESQGSCPARVRKVGPEQHSPRLPQTTAERNNGKPNTTRSFPALDSMECPPYRHVLSQPRKHESLDHR